MNILAPGEQMTSRAWYHGQGVKSNPLQLKPGCEDYSFLDQIVKDPEHGLDSILTDFVNTPELEVSFDEADDMPSSVSSGFLCLVSTHSGNSKLQLAPSIKCLALLCHARALCLPVIQ